MKLPYRVGDSFALPLGNGQFARSCIVQCEHRVVVVRVFLSDQSWLDLRVSDDALVLQRWKPDSRVDVSGIAEPRPENRYWMHAARAERIGAAALGTPHPRQRNVHVRELRDDNVAIALAELDDDSILTLTGRVSQETLDRLRTALFNHPGLTIRLNGDAASHLDTLSQTPATRLSLAGPIDRLAPIASLQHLDLEVADQLPAVAAAFPNLESLRVSQRGAAIDIRDLGSLHQLRALDLSLIHLADAAQIAQLSQLYALRLNRITGVRTAAALAALKLRTLAIEHLHELERLDALARMASLEQLELVGLWQFEIPHVQWTLGCAQLVRAEIDIGGRRKNVELYRNAHWAYPWKF